MIKTAKQVCNVNKKSVSSGTEKARRRPDIQGLRTVAVFFKGKEL